MVATSALVGQVNHDDLPFSNDVYRMVATSALVLQVSHEIYFYNLYPSITQWQ